MTMQLRRESADLRQRLWTCEQDCPFALLREYVRNCSVTFEERSYAIIESCLFFLNLCALSLTLEQ